MLQSNKKTMTDRFDEIFAPLFYIFMIAILYVFVLLPLYILLGDEQDRNEKKRARSDINNYR